VPHVEKGASEHAAITLFRVAVHHHDDGIRRAVVRRIEVRRHPGDLRPLDADTLVARHVEDHRMFFQVHVEERRRQDCRRH
jgi:hypothetical protein